jgi:multiple sugar transport system permease protein
VNSSGAYRPHRPTLRRQASRALAYTLPWAFLAPLMFPFLWMALTSLKTHADNITYPPLFIFRVTFHNYVEVFRQNPFGAYLLNSFVIALGSTLLAVVLGAPAAYSIARRRLRGLALGILIARMVPGIAYLVPWYVVFRYLGLLDTYVALVLTHLIVSLPIVVWLMIGFYEDLPTDLEQAAQIDGCSRFQAFMRIALPLTRPGLVAAVIVSFIYSWNNFLFSLILAGDKTKTLPVAAFNFMTYGMIHWGGLAAAATVITAPVVLLTFVIQRHIVRGLVAGATIG